MIIVDTGFWVALLDKKDKYHAASKQALQQNNEPLITTWPVMTETCYLLIRKRNGRIASSFIHNFSQGLFDVFDLKKSHSARVSQLMQKYADLLTNGLSRRLHGHSG